MAVDTMESSIVNAHLPTTAAVSATTTTTTTATTALETETTETAPTLTPTIRIYVDTTNLPRPVIVNYRQLYKRELKKLQEIDPPAVNTTTTAGLPPPRPPQQSANDGSSDSVNNAFYRELLKKAEAYHVDDEDASDDGSDEENPGNESKRRNDYDFEDPFIDDSDMLMAEPIDDCASEYDGFFVWHGPLDGHELAATTSASATTTAATAAAATSTSTSATTSTSTTKRKTTAKPKTVVSNTLKKDSGSAAALGSEKSRKKVVVTNDGPVDDKKKSSQTTTAAPMSTTPATTTTTKAKKSALTPVPMISSNSAIKKVYAAPDKTAKKKAKLDYCSITKEEELVVAHKPMAASSPAISTLVTVDDSSATATTTTTSIDKSKKKSGTMPGALTPLDPDIEVLMEKLRQDVKAEDFSNKAKFPASLKPTVLEAGLITFRKNRIIDDNLVFHLMNILPYNKFTLKKFLTTKSGQMRVDELQQEIDELAILLKQTIDRMMPEQRRIFNVKVAHAQASSTEPSTKPVDEDITPIPKFKCNDEVRKILYEIIQTEEQSIHIANQVALHKDSEKKVEGLASDGKARKLMYQRLLSCWPEGWMHSYEMSRQYSQYKSKVSTMSEKKNANPSLPATPKAHIPIVESNKKRKRPTPTNSSEVVRKKQLVTDMASASTAEPQEPEDIITIDDDGDDIQPAWNHANSMKIEALISGSNIEKFDHYINWTGDRFKMSYFGNGAQQQQTINPQNIALAEQELEMVTDLFNRIVDSCHSKCVKLDVGSGELSQQDQTCIDNCVAKFFETNSKVGEKMQKMSQ